MVSDSTDIGTIFLEIIKCGANLVSEFFMFFSKIFELNYLQRIPAANSLFFTVLSHICLSKLPLLRPILIVLETWKWKKPVDFQAGKNRLISQLCLLTGNADRVGDRLKRTFLALTPW